MKNLPSLIILLMLVFTSCKKIPQYPVKEQLFPHVSAPQYMIPCVAAMVKHTEINVKLNAKDSQVEQKANVHELKKII